VNGDVRSGFRLAAGWWFADHGTLGIEGGFSVLESQATLFGAASDGTVILARPFTDARDGTAQASLVAFPGSSTGSITVRAASGNFYEAHFDFTEKVFDTDGIRLDSLLGYRFFHYTEALGVRTVVNPTDPNFVPGTQVVTGDDFNTHNEFH